MPEYVLRVFILDDKEERIMNAWGLARKGKNKKFS